MGFPWESYKRKEKGIERGGIFVRLANTFSSDLRSGSRYYDDDRNRGKSPSNARMALCCKVNEVNTNREDENFRISGRASGVCDVLPGTRESHPGAFKLNINNGNNVLRLIRNHLVSRFLFPLFFFLGNYQQNGRPIACLRSDVPDNRPLPKVGISLHHTINNLWLDQWSERRIPNISRDNR